MKKNKLGKMPSVDRAKLAIQQIRVAEAAQEIVDKMREKLDEFYIKASLAGLIATKLIGSGQTKYGFTVAVEIDPEFKQVIFDNESDLVEYMTEYIELHRLETFR